MSAQPAGSKGGCIAIIGEHWKGVLSDLTFEMLACGRALADAAHLELRCVLLTDKADPYKALPLAADKVLIVEDRQLREFSSEAYTKVLGPLLQSLAPRLVILGNTTVGMDLAGPLSLALGAAAVSNGVAISYENGQFVATSKVYGGKIMARCSIPAKTSLVLLSPGSYQKEQGTRPQLPAVEIVKPPVAVEPLRTQFQKFIEPEVVGVDITKVPVLVAVGRGIQGKDNIAMAEELAEALGGAVCATRPVVDQGWLPRSRQVGRSGMTVKPRLYLALGVSGAPEHLEGMKDSELIVAVNTDGSAPIFDNAQYGCVQDVLDVVPALIEKIKARRGG